MKELKVWLTLFIPEPTTAMAEIAQALMAENAELDLPLVIRIKAGGSALAALLCPRHAAGTGFFLLGLHDETH